MVVIVFFLALALTVVPLLGMASIIWPALILCSIGFVCNFISLAWVMAAKRVQYRVYFATFVDIFLITAAVHYCGGLESTFSWIYVVVLITIGYLHGTRISMYAASLSWLMYFALLVCEFKGLIPHVDFHRLDPVYFHDDASYLNVTLFSNFILFFVTAGISGFLSERLLRSKNELEKTVTERTEELTMANEQLRNEIEERKRSEEELRNSEERLQILFDSAPDAYYVTDLEGKFVDGNKAAERLIGHRKEELIGKSFLDLDLAPPDQILKAAETLAEIARGVPSGPGELTLNRKDGSQIIAEIVTFPITIGDQSLALGIARDITRRKQAEKALRFTQFSIDRSADAAIWMGPDARFIYVNEAACRSLGYSRKELLSMSVFDIDPDFPPDVWKKHWKDIKERGTFTIESHHRTREGKLFPVEVTVNFMEFEGKEYNCAYVHDITERKKARVELEKSMSLLTATLESTADAILVVDLEGGLQRFNQKLLEMWNVSEQFSTTIKSDNGAPPEQPLLSHPEEEFMRAEEIYEDPDRERFDVLELTDGRILERYTKPQKVGGKTIGIVLSFRDITEQKQLERQLLQAQKMESIGTLAGGIAHDFNNLLGGILGYASLTKSEISKDHRIFRYIETIEKSAVRAAELTSQLLAFARGGKYEVRPVDLNGIIEETINMVGRTFDKSIEIKTHLNDKLPTVEADSGQLQQVLLNLCVNAADAMPGGGKLVIETGTEVLTEEYVRTHMEAKPGSHVVLTLTDTGVGMDRETIERIFEPFFTTKGEGKGTGLGLSMVYGVVKNHGGHIRVYSEPGEGSTFRIYLPADGKPETREPTETEAPCGGTELVLVVDDEESIRALARDMLENNGYSVLLAENGEEAIEVYGRHNGDISLVILDMIMPRMGGRETFLKLKACNPEVKALLSTGYSKNAKAQEILDSGVMGFIQKPYQVDALLSKVRTVIDSECVGEN